MSENSKKKMGLSGIVFFILSGLIGIDALAPAAAVGPSVFGWWAIVVLLFVVPYVLMVCELSAAYPGEGAIYDWTLQAMGRKNAARVSWYYWINVPFWIPAVFLVCVGMFSELFFPDMSTWTMIFICIAMVWAAIFVVNASLDIGNLVNTLGGLSKVGILIALAAGGYMLLADKGAPVAEITLESVKPTMGESFKYAPTLIYMFLGVETIACMGDSVEKPSRNIPLGVFIAMAIIILLYWVATGAMIMAIPAEDLSLVGGIVQTLQILFGGSAAGDTIVVVLTLFAAIGLFTYIIPWIMAASRAAKEAADAGEMPAIFAKMNKHDSPVGANTLTGIVATFALIVYGFMAGNAEDLFWSLFAFSSFLLFCTYFFFFISFVKLRKMDPDTPRPFRVFGGDTVAFYIALVPSLVIAFGCALFVFPDILSGEIDWNYSLTVLVSVLVSGH